MQVQLHCLKTTIKAVSVAEKGKGGELWVKKEEKPSTHRE